MLNQGLLHSVNSTAVLLSIFSTCSTLTRGTGHHCEGSRACRCLTKDLEKSHSTSALDRQTKRKTLWNSASKSCEFLNHKAHFHIASTALFRSNLWGHHHQLQRTLRDSLAAERTVGVRDSFSVLVLRGRSLPATALARIVMQNCKQPCSLRYSVDWILYDSRSGSVSITLYHVKGRFQLLQHQKDPKGGKSRAMLQHIRHLAGVRTKLNSALSAGLTEVCDGKVPS